MKTIDQFIDDQISMAHTKLDAKLIAFGDKYRCPSVFETKEPDLFDVWLTKSVIETGVRNVQGVMRVEAEEYNGTLVLFVHHPYHHIIIENELRFDIRKLVRRHLPVSYFCDISLIEYDKYDDPDNCCAGCGKPFPEGGLAYCDLCDDYLAYCD